MVMGQSVPLQREEKSARKSTHTELVGFAIHRAVAVGCLDGGIIGVSFAIGHITWKSVSRARARPNRCEDNAWPAHRNIQIVL